MLTSIVHAMTAQLVPFLGSWDFPSISALLQSMKMCPQHVRNSSVGQLYTQCVLEMAMAHPSCRACQWDLHIMLVTSLDIRKSTASK